MSKETDTQQSDKDPEDNQDSDPELAVHFYFGSRRFDLPKHTVIFVSGLEEGKLFGFEIHRFVEIPRLNTGYINFSAETQKDDQLYESYEAGSVKIDSDPDGNPIGLSFSDMSSTRMSLGSLDLQFDKKNRQKKRPVKNKGQQLGQAGGHRVVELDLADTIEEIGTFSPDRRQ